MTVKFTNNASSSLSSGINSTATSLTVADASTFPSLSGADDYCYLTIQQATATTREVVKATARSGNTFTVQRGVDNTTAASFSSGDTVELRLTSALLQDVIDQATVEGIKTNFQYVPTAGQTQFSGADSSGDTMIINDSELVNVYMNGVRLVQGSDYTVSSANNRITLTSGATTADIIDIEVFGNFTGQSGAAVAITGGAIAGTAITTGSINNTPIGATQANTVAATTLTANSVAVDNITIDGTEIDLSSGDLTLDVAGNIILDADGAVVKIQDGGADLAQFSSGSQNLNIRSLVADKDIRLQGYDGDLSTLVTALTLDMSEAGAATFNSTVGIGSGSGTTASSGYDEFVIQGADADIGMAFLSPAANNRTQTIAFGDSNNNASGKITYNHSTDAMGFRVAGGSDAITVNSSGVGIGTSSPRSASNYGVLAVNGSFGAIVDFELGESLKTTLTQSSSQFEINVVPAIPLVFKTNNSEAMRIGSGGRVSFGPDALDIQIDPASTNSGNNILYMRGNASDDKSQIQLNHFGHADFHIGVGHVGDGKFNIANTQTGTDFVIDTSGNVGIGTGSPSALLNVNTASSGSHDAIVISRTTHGTVGTLKNAAGSLEITSNKQLVLGADPTNAFTAAGSEIQFQTDGTTKMTLASGGNLGIGTTDPAAELHVNKTNAGGLGGRLLIQNTSSSSGSFCQLIMAPTAATAADRCVVIQAENTDGNNNQAMIFKISAGASPVERMRIDSSGNLLVKRNSSSHGSFDFETSQGNGKGGQIGRVVCGRSATGYPIVGYNCAPTSSVNTYNKFLGDYASWIHFTAGGINTFTTTTTTSENTTGTAGPYVSRGGTSWTSSSDRRLKDKVEGITHGLEAVKSLNPVSYVRNDRDTGATELGFIAQEVDEVVSEVVNIAEDGYYGIQYERLIPVLTKAIQEQQAQIESLQAEVEALKNG